jgi:hypothetical protein
MDNANTAEALAVVLKCASMCFGFNRCEKTKEAQPGSRASLNPTDLSRT